MRINVKLLTGKTIQIEVQAHDMVSDVMAKIGEMEGIPPRLQRLIFNGRQLKEDSPLSNCNISNEDTIKLVLRLLSCEKCPGRDQATVRS